MTSVGPRCPDHAQQGKPRLRPPVQVRAQRRALSFRTTQPVVTWGLVAVNVVVYLITVAQGAGINQPGGSLFFKWVLYGPAVKDGDWWRLITAMFLHAGILHIGLNMLALVWLGGPVERYLGPFRYLALYFVSGLAGSAGALVVSPNSITVGASGAIFGILGALLIIEYQATGSLAGQAMSLIVINLIFSFTFSNISIGGHVGGLIGGILAMLAMSQGGRRHVAYGSPGAIGVAGLLAVGIASVGVAYWAVNRAPAPQPFGAAAPAAVRHIAGAGRVTGSSPVRWTSSTLATRIHARNARNEINVIAPVGLKKPVVLTDNAPSRSTAAATSDSHPNHSGSTLVRFVAT
jgi:membrane associated rhomboid family serine protease